MAGHEAVVSVGEVENRHQRRQPEDSADLSASMCSSASSPRQGFRASLGLSGVGRRTLGICFLLVTVFLWTLSNFLASTLFSDNTYSKPFFVVYMNSTVFVLSLIPKFVLYLRRTGLRGLRNDLVRLRNDFKLHGASLEPSREEDDDFATQRLLVNQDDDAESRKYGTDKLGLRETLVLSLEFSMLWFVANYFVSACFEYTSVASGTILSSTSSVWTLIFCSLFRIEAFSFRKLLGVMGSLVGVILVSTVDLSGKSDEDRGSFPHKTPGQIAIGDAMAFFSAMVYGVYVTVMKYRVGDEDRVDMQLFFGLVGLFNMTLLWPIFFILHWTGLETFGLPPTSWIWTIVLCNSLSSFVSDISWAWAMLLTTPLVVTVGISLTIPLSLIGEMFQYGRYSSFVYWVGASVVFLSFLFINHESHDAVDERNEEDEEDHVREETV